MSGFLLRGGTWSELCFTKYFPCFVEKRLTKGKGGNRETHENAFAVSKTEMIVAWNKLVEIGVVRSSQTYVSNLRKVERIAGNTHVLSNIYNC